MKTPATMPKPVDALLDDILPVVPYIGQWLLEFCVDIGVALIHPFSLLVRGQRINSLFELAARLLLTLMRYPVQLLLTVGSLVLNAAASLINNKLSGSHERSLTLDERQYLQTIFADSVAYDAVRIQFGGVKEALRVSPQAVGNDIFIREFWGARTAYPDFTLSTEGLRLLGHEVAHVWQYQNMGAGYIGDSLMTQVLDVVGRKLGIHLSDGYDLRSAVMKRCPIDECNVEQQAVMAEMIGAACRQSDCGSLTRESFNRVSGFNLSEEEFAPAKLAHTWFGQKC